MKRFFTLALLLSCVGGCATLAVAAKYLAVPLLSAAVKGGTAVKDDEKTQADALCYCGHTTRLHEDGVGACTKCKCAKFTWLRELKPEEDPEG